MLSMFEDFDVEKFLAYSPRFTPKDKITHSHTKVGKEIYQPDIYSYIFNSDNFRSIELNPATDIVALGCSHTFGVGLPVEYTWVQQLSYMVSKDIINISDSGAGVQYLINTFYHFYNREKINPKILLCNFPNFFRYRKYSLKDNIVLNKADYMDRKDMELNLLSMIEAIESVDNLEFFCKKNNIQLFWTVWDYSFGEMEIYNFFTKRYKNYCYDAQAYSFEKVNSMTEIDLKSNIKIDLRPEDLNDQTILYCHENEKEIYKDLFYMALDRYDLPRKYQEIHDQKKLTSEQLNNLKKYLSNNKPASIHGAHHGWHRNHHWALFFHNLIKELV